MQYFWGQDYGCYLAGGHSRSTSTNHGISDSVITPVLFALSRGEQRQGGLLQEAWARYTQKGDTQTFKSSGCQQPHRLVCAKALHRSQVWPVLPQPVVTHLVPEGILVVEEARHTGDTRVFICTGEDSFRRVMSLLKFWEL